MRESLLLIGLLLITILGLILRHRLIIKKKNQTIIRQIKEWDRLEKNTEQLYRKHIALYKQLKVKNS